MLPPAAFTDPSVLEWELESLFGGGWICAATSSPVAEPGAYVMREIGDQSLFVIGGEDGRPRAFHNVCRHRGARIVEDAEGNDAADPLPLPRLVLRVRRRVAAPRRTPTGSRTSTRGATGWCRCATEVVGGLVLVDLGGSAPAAGEHVGEPGRAARPLPGRLAWARGASRDYEVEANWKAIAENYSECLHCPGRPPRAQRAQRLRER